jgi:predicted  nucleic acid-binding Zn-ribbon protein
MKVFNFVIVFMVVIILLALLFDTMSYIPVKMNETFNEDKSLEIRIQNIERLNNTMNDKMKQLDTRVQQLESLLNGMKSGVRNMVNVSKNVLGNIENNLM